MNGTEKQVKWAEDIKAQTMTKVAEMRKQFEADAARAKASTSDPRYIDAIAIFDRCVAKLEAQTEATWWIDNRSQVVNRKFVQQMGSN
jgi:hypothetical protein